jgi:hypothetical protein
MNNVSKLAAFPMSVVALLAQPAIAETAKNSAAAAAIASGAGNGPKQKAADLKYCVKTETTGSRLPKRVCMTQREWEDNGVDILAQNR